MMSGLVFIDVSNPFIHLTGINDMKKGSYHSLLEKSLITRIGDT